MSEDDGNDDLESSNEAYIPFSSYKELGNKIKQALQSGRKSSPSVWIELPFDEALFHGGLGRAGTMDSSLRRGRRRVYRLKK